MHTRLQREALEALLPSLRLLHDMYDMVDASVASALRESAAPLACHKGCARCCNQPVPATELEILGLRLYLRHLCPPSTLRSLDVQRCGTRCFFLGAGDHCLAYDFRPVACRRYLLCGEPCAPGETPTQTRPGQMLIPDRNAMLAALRHTAPFYTARRLPHAPHSLEDFKAVSMLLHSVNWQAELTGILRTSPH